MSQCLRVKGIEVQAYHGCISEEAKVGTKFTVDVAFFGNFTHAAETDNLDCAIDYVTVAEIVHEQLAIKQKLIETVAFNLLNKLKVKFPLATEIQLTITKHRAPIELPVKEVSFTISG